MTERLDRMEAFLEHAGWAKATRTLVAGDASNRRYERLNRYTGETAILMDAPPEKGEDVKPFIAIAQHLCDIGLSAPHILAEDVQHGFLVIEDLGDAIYARVLEKEPKLEMEIYTAAVNVLVHLHTAPSPKLPRYDAPRMTDLAALAFDWYQLGTLGRIFGRDAFCAEFHRVLQPLDTHPGVLIQRDYHAENLIWMPERKGVARVGLLDFQDAMLGHPAYDLVSVLQDARRDVPPELEHLMIDHMLAESQTVNDAFHYAYSALGVQRNMRILGVFARLSMAYGKTHYIDLIPRVWDLLLRNLNQPAMSQVKALIEDVLPAPTASNLTKLKDLCGQHPLP